MSVVNLFNIFVKMERRHILKRLSIIILCSISISIIHTAIFQIIKSNYNINVVKSFFPERERLYNINIYVDNITGEYDQYVKEFIRSLSGIEGVEFCGLYYDVNVEFDDLKDSEEFLNYNQKIVSGTEREGYSSLINICYIDKSMLSFFELNDLKRPKHDDIYPMLVGYDYKDYFKKGKVYKDSSGIRYQVCGILPKDFKIPAYDLLWSEMPCENLNKSVVTIYDYDEMRMDRFILNACNSIYCETDGRDETEENIKEMANRFLVRMSLNTINDKIEIYKTQERYNNNITLLFAIIVSVSAVVAVLASSIIQIIIKKQEYGILYANGVSYYDIVKIIIIQNVICMTIAFMVATFFSIKSINNNSIFQAVDLVNIFKEMVIAKTLGIVVAILLISIIIPSYILKKMKIIDMLRGSEI